MNTINFTRIRRLWLHQTLCRKKYMLTIGLGTLFGLYVIRYSGIVYNATLYDFESMYFVAFCIYMAAFMANTFSDMKTKEKRISFLSLPATATEKFIAYSTWYIVVPIILFAVALIGSELPGALTVHLLGNATQKANETILLPYMITDSYVYIMFHIQESIFIAVMCVFMASLFLLGSCIWYRNVFLKTVAAIGTVIFFLIIGFVAFVSILKYYEVDNNIRMKLLFFYYPGVYGFRVWYVPFSIGVVLVWWLSYHLFKRRELISQKRNWKYLLKRHK